MTHATNKPDTTRSRREPSNRGLRLCIRTTCLLVIALPTGASALQDVQILMQQPAARLVPDYASGEENRLNPVVDRDAERWLDRAAEAAEREDWKLAADTLSRVIDEYGDRTVSSDDSQRFFSAATVARQQLMQWPPAGVQAYRVLYDAEAQGHYLAAKKTHDVDKLRLIARKYPMTTIAPEALDLLANWLLDRGGGGEALDVLAQLETLPHNKVSRWKILARRAVAYAMAHQPIRAAATIEEIRTLLEKKDASIPADAADRLEQVASFVASRQQLDSSERADLPLQSWPWLLGPSHLAGRMQPTNPAVTQDEFWRDVLPGTERIDLSLVNQLMVERGRPPVWQCVSDGRALFVTSPEGVMARDLATFDLLWRSVPRARPRDLSVVQFRMNVGTLDGDNRDRLDELSTVTLFHEYRGAVSYGHGLVFIIEQLGATGERFPTRKGIVDPNDNYGIGGQSEPNSLRAFEADTGRAVWTRGRGGAADDELRFVHFYSPPVTCGPHLLSVFQAGSDLNLAVLDPNGKLVRKVLLGSARTGLFPMNGVLQPAVHDGTVYQPTGAGMLIALNAFDYSLRWLASYDRAEFVVRNRPGRDVPWVGRGRSAAQLDEWLSTPPIIAAGLVVVAPHDSDKLLAFDRQTGQLAWSHPRGSLRYLVGGDNRFILAAGTTVASIDAANGLTRWHNQDYSPTGRPALCGDDVLVPTLDGLVRLDALTGEQRGMLLPTSQALGNLLALDGALYSVTPTSISKFPDVQQSRRMAQQALERDPEDLGATLRLAWLASIERHWNEALELLDRSEKLLEARADSDIAARVAHQRVEVLLGLAAESPADQRARIIERAAQSSQRPDDVIRTSLAMAELRVEEGRVADSFQQVVSLLRELGDEPTALESHLHARASVIIRERLSSLWQRAPDAQREEMLDGLKTKLAEDMTAARYGELLRLADGLVAGSTSNQPNSEVRDGRLHELAAGLDVRLGNWNMEEGDPESAVFFWERAVRRAASSAAGREALGHLAIAYAAVDADWPAAPAESARVLELLRKHPAKAEMPASLRVQRTDANETCQAFVARVESLLPSAGVGKTSTMPRILEGSRRLELTGQDEIPSSMALRDTASFFDPTARPDRFAGILPIVKLSRVIGVQTQGQSSERAAWTNDLGQVVEDQEAVIREWSILNTRPAAMAGRVAALASGGRISAIGLMSGRMMWPSIFVDPDGGALPDPPVAHIDGILILATHANTLVAIPARQGARPMWRRQFSGRPIGTLAMVNGHVVAIDAAGEVLTLLDPYSGRVRRQYGLLVPTAQSQKETRVQEALKEILRVARGGADEQEADPIEAAVESQLAIVGGTVCRSGYSRVVGRDIETGRSIWEVPVTGMINGVLALNDRYVGVCHGRNRMTVVDAGNGAIVTEIQAKGLLMPPEDAVVDPPPASLGSAGERLIVFARTTGDTPQYVLACFPLKEGEQGWRQDLGPLATVSRRMLRASPDYIAAVAYEFRADNRMAQARPWWVRGAPNLAAARLFVFDKGGRRRLIESPYTFEIAKTDDRSYSGLLSDVVIFDDRIVAIGPDGYYVLQASEDASAMERPAQSTDTAARRIERGEP